MIAQTPSSLPSVSGGGAVDHVEISPRLRLESDVGCLSFGGAAVFHVGMGDRLRFSSSSGFASELRFDDTGAVLLVPLEGRRESSDIDGRRTRDDVRTGSSVLTDLWSPRPLSARSAAAWPRCLACDWNRCAFVPGWKSGVWRSSAA